ncbi:radical SAM protein [Pseudodesulfovibrio tunisiensis]|uniref:radical SAM protein n=1 Tax=Pseudodesulfovibrio tunisiensis TaxID=463192 RepID=UPI001FB3BAAC|nr:radical SAM protein [Pseudodesulfovibrio tunisiensis]
MAVDGPVFSDFRDPGLMTTITFAHPEPRHVAARIFPVFLPFAGCPHRCVFCAQDVQTGHGADPLERIATELVRDLEEAVELGRGPYELAFYGGTFTALPAPYPEHFLSIAARFRERGLITAVRCSTRPDCVDVPGLQRLGGLGLDTVELGIQSFDDHALGASGRGYDGRTARAGCETVLASGLNLGVQLLPGLPGDHEGLFQEDVRIAASLGPKTARLYPCLVIRGAALARLWERGRYAPWPLERAKSELGEALLEFWARDVRVIRLGVAPEPSLAANLLAGPWHPALGQSARARALFAFLQSRIREFTAQHGPLSRLDVPRRYQGELFGHGNELAEAYAPLGVTRATVRYVEGGKFSLS